MKSPHQLSKLPSYPLQLEIEPEPSEESYDEEEELAALVQATVKNRKQQSASLASLRHDGVSRLERLRRFGGARSARLIGVMACTFYLLYLFSPGDLKNSSSQEYRDEDILHYECPATKSMDFSDGRATNEDYNKVSNTTDPETFIKVFRDSNYDDWGKTYKEIKAGMFHWKSTRFLDLDQNSSIYESACGIGLNLVMTLEILKEVKGLQGVVVYGSDFAGASISLANQLVHRGILPANARRGELCQGDSSNLEFVPSNAFDLSFTGYITPLVDPLNLGLKGEKLDVRHTAICQGTSRKDKALVSRMQNRQESWYARWVKELIRIAKPGAPVIIEQISYPLCEAFFDWGGVGQNFWKEGIEKYKWDVDPGSMEFEDDEIMTRRYHVFMRKNKQ